MKIQINFTPHSCISLLLSFTLLCNTVSPAFSQTVSTRSLSASQQEYVNRQTYVAQNNSIPAVDTTAMRVQSTIDQLSRGSLSKAQLARLNQIRWMFTPKQVSENPKSDFEQFQTFFNEQIENEYQREKQSLADSQTSLQQEINTTANNYRKEAYEQLVHQVASKIVSAQPNATQSANQLSNTLLRDLQTLSIDPQTDLSTQIASLSQRYSNNPQALEALSEISQAVQEDNKYLVREQAVAEWKAQAQAHLQSWYRENTTLLNRWKKQTASKAQEVFDQDFSQQLLKAREEEVKKAVQDLWAYKDLAPQAHQTLLSLALSILPMRTLDGASFFTAQQRAWLETQYLKSVRDGKTCGDENPTATSCQFALIGVSGLGMVSDSTQSAHAIEEFMTAKRKTPYAVPALLTGAAALLSMKQYSVLRGFIHSASQEEFNLDSLDILSFETLVNAVANTNGRYLGEVTKYTQYPLHENPTDQTAMGNAWEDLAELLAEEGSSEALSILREYGVEKCSVYTKTTTTLKKETVLHCVGITPFLVGALASGKSGAEQYKPTSTETVPGYFLDARGKSHYISEEQARQAQAKLTANINAFKQHASSMGLTNTAMIARYLFLQSMGDLNAESELRVDNRLYNAYAQSLQNKTPKPGFAITAYTRNSAPYNAKRARQDRTQFFRKAARLADIAFLIWCIVDITKWAHSGFKLARALTKASYMARNGATVAQRAVMLRQLNIAPKLRTLVSVPRTVKGRIAPTVLAQMPLFTSQTIELPRFPGFIESAGQIAANSLRFSAETGTLGVEAAAMQEAGAGTLSSGRIAAFDQMLGQAANNTNIQFANRSPWQRLFTWNKDNAYRSQLASEVLRLGEKAGFTAEELNPIHFRLSSSYVPVPQNIASFQVPSLLRATEGMPVLDTQALTRVMTTSLGTAPTAQQLAHTQGLFNAALADANMQFLNRNWFSRQWNFLWNNGAKSYKNILLDNLAARFDKDAKIFTDPAQYNLYRSLITTIEKDQEFQAPSFLTQLNQWSAAGASKGKFHTMGTALLSTADETHAPQVLPLVFQMQRKRWLRGGISGVGSTAYQRVLITDKDGSLLFGFGNDLKNPLKPSQFKLTLESEEIPTLIRAAAQETNAAATPLEIKLTSVGGGVFSPSFYSSRWTAFKQARLDGKWFPLGTFFRGKNDIYVHNIPVQIRAANGSLRTVPVVFKSDSYLGLRNVTAVLEEGGKLAWYQDGTRLLYAPKLQYSLPKNQIRPFLGILRDADIRNPLHVTAVSGRDKIQPLMWATGLSLSSASTGLIAPLENVYGDRITETHKTWISLALPYAPSLFAPFFSPLVMKIGALRTLQVALGVSTAGLGFAAYSGFSGKLDKNNLPPVWPLFVSGTAIGISSALSRSGLNLLIDSMGGGGTLLKSMAYKNVGSFALLLPPFIANFVDKDIDFSLAFPVLGTLSAGALTWVSASRLSTNIGKLDGFMPLKPLKLFHPTTWPNLVPNIATASKLTWQEAYSTTRLLATKEVLPLVLAATAFTGFEAGAFSKAGNQMIRPHVKQKELPGWVEESNRNNYTAMLTNLSVISFPLLMRLTAKPTLRFLENGKAGDEYRRMLKASFALNATGAYLLYQNGFDGYTSPGMLGIALMGLGTANMTQSFQKLSNINVVNSGYARMLTSGLEQTAKKQLEKSLVTKTMTGFPVQQLGIAIVPTIVSSYTDRQIAEGVIQKSEAPHSSLWIPITSLALCFGLSASNIGLFPTKIPTGVLGLSKGVIGSYPNAVNQLQQPQFYLKQPAYGVPPGFSPLLTRPVVNMRDIIPAQRVLENIETSLEQATPQAPEPTTLLEEQPLTPAVETIESPVEGKVI